LEIIKSPEEIDRHEWGAFVHNHPLGNIYQAPEFYDMIKRTKNYKPFVLFVKEANELKGVLQAVFMKEGAGLKAKLSARAIIVGGPLIKNNAEYILNYMLKEYDVIVKDEVIYSQIREIHELTFSDTLIKYAFNEELRLNIVVDLTQTAEQLWNNVHHKRRNEIRRAEKNMVSVKVIENLGDVERGFQILKEVYQRAKLPLADKSLFINCFTYLSPTNNAIFYGAYHENNLIGVMFTLCYKDRIIDWYAGSSSEHYDKNPNDIIPWRAILDAKEKGFKIFDFGGAGKPDVEYGVRDYKKKFGGEFIELKRFQKIHKPRLMELGKIGLKVWQRFNK
jgi:lipid II:glycine glycyltransferase (peptidoglycan interpeptide bridge formation enzyme)